MKHTYSLLIFCAMLIAPVSLRAESTKLTAKEIAPLLTESTVMAFHVNLADGGLESLGETVIADLGKTFGHLGFDDNSLQRVVPEAEKVLRVIGHRITGHLDKVRKQCNVREGLFLLMVEKKERTGGDADDREMSPVLMTFCLAVPTAGRNEKERDALRDMIASLPDADERIFPAEYAGFDLFVISMRFGKTSKNMYAEEYEEMDDEKVKLLFREQKTDAEALLKKAWNADPSQTMEGLFFYNEGMAELLRFSMNVNSEFAEIQEDLMKRYYDFILKMSREIEWASFGSDLKTLRYDVVFQAKDEESAAKLHGILLEFCDFLGEFYATILKTAVDEGELPSGLSSFIGEWVRGLYRTMIPKPEGDRLVWNLDCRPYTSPLLTFYGIVLLPLIPEPQ